MSREPVFLEVDLKTAQALHTLVRVGVEGMRSNVEKSMSQTEELLSPSDVELLVNYIRFGEHVCAELQSKYPSIQCPFSFRSQS